MMQDRSTAEQAAKGPRRSPYIKRPIPLAVIVLLALILRVLALTSRPLWYDEAFAILFAEQGPAAMLYGTLAPAGGTAADVHPLGYYTILWGWMNGFGQSISAVRSLSILIGIGIVLLSYALGIALFGKRKGSYLALLIALSPFQVHYAQEIRMYALLALALLLATYALYRGMQNGPWHWWVVFAVSAGLAQYTHNLAVFTLIPLALTPVLARNKPAVIKTILAGMGALVLYLPWLVRLPAQFAKVQTSYWTNRPSFDRLVTTLLSFTTNLPIRESWLALALFTTLAVFVLAIIQSWRAVRSKEESAWRGLWLAYLALTPPALLFLVSQWLPIFIERALLPAGVFFLLWVGWALGTTKMPTLVRIVVFSLLVFTMGLGLIEHLTYRGYPYAPYQALDEYLAANVAQDEVILHSNKLTMLPGVYYDRSLNQSYLADPPGSGADTLALPTQEVIQLFAKDDLAEAVGAAEIVWFIIFDRAIDEYQALGEENHPHLIWLSENYQQDRVETWGDVSLYVFSN
jgi:4-amino-4-deoxy-L-arabinose transferase-like glycosyltransferase